MLTSADETVKAIPLPPHTMAVLQPMDQSILLQIKYTYRNLLLTDIQECALHRIDDYLKDISMVDVCWMLAEAWDQITQCQLQRSWNRLMGISPIPKYKSRP